VFAGWRLWFLSRVERVFHIKSRILLRFDFFILVVYTPSFITLKSSEDGKLKITNYKISSFSLLR
jgi:hypothetical protein